MSLKDLNLDSFDIDKMETESRWNILLDEIMKGNVIPVIGADFQVDDQENLETQLINLFVRTFNVTTTPKPKSFSQLFYDKSFTIAVDKRDKIYTLIGNVLAKVVPEPSKLLIKLMQTKMFPLVITTSFTDVVEKAMDEVWGKDNVRVLQFNNNPDNDLRPGKGDVYSERELEQPTVFYMFGKYSTNPHRYVVTDLDMMNFCKAWISGVSVPRVLSQVIRQKYLLFLGNTYSDWLFRFIWYSMRTSNDYHPSVFISEHIEQSLEQFLNSLETFIQTDPNKAVDEIVTRIQNRVKQDTSTTTKCKYDVFISYSRSDLEVAKMLYETLRQKGLRVWFDTSGGIPAWNNWQQKITEGIKQSRLFVPILSKNIETEILQVHEYRTEWATADAIAMRRGGMSFICPIAEREFDFYNENTGIPKSFKSQNAAWYANLNDLDDLAEKLCARIGDFKKMERELNNDN